MYNVGIRRRNTRAKYSLKLRRLTDSLTILTAEEDMPNAAVEVGLFSVEGRIQLQFRITFQSRLRDIVADNNRVIKSKESKSALVSLVKSFRATRYIWRGKRRETQRV